MNKYDIGKWDLHDLIKKSKEIDNIINLIKKKSKKIEVIQSKLNQRIPSKEFLDILHKLEDINNDMNVVNGYTSLSYATNTQSDDAATLMLKINKFSSDISNKLLFFDLWWKKKINDKTVKRLLKCSGELSEYLAHKRNMGKYALSEKEERIINILDITGVSALLKLYEKITNSFEYVMKVNNRKNRLTRDEISIFVRNPKLTVRKTAYNIILSKFKENSAVLGDIYKNIVLNWRHEGIELRGFPSPISIRNLENNIDDKIVTTLLDICKKKSYIFQKFFIKKAKFLDVEKLNRYDLYAPIFINKEKKYTYNESMNLVLTSIKNFDADVFKLACGIVDSNHIDSLVRFGKRGGAFCSTIVPNVIPYILINFTGDLKDIFTLAHELGHAIHSQVSSDKSILVHEAPLPLAETASTFSELLLYDDLINKVNDHEKMAMVSERIIDLYASIMRQAFFTEFEITAHNKIATGATIDDISKIYFNNLKVQFGKSLIIPDNFSIEWCSIPHFFYSPFYCYSYTFGNLLSLSLFQKYKQENEFADTFIKILKSGGSKKPQLLLEDYGFDINSYKFWQCGFDYIENQIKFVSSM